MRLFATALAAIAGSAFIAGCSTATTATTATTTSTTEPDSGPANVVNVAELGLALGCVDPIVDDGFGWCRIRGGDHFVGVTNDPVGYARGYLGAVDPNGRETAVGVGGNWFFVCGSALSDSDCLEVIAPLDGSLVVR